jgi:HEPN domain-containing protein
MQGNDLFADEIFGFHVQQAVEKTLKALLCTCADADYPMTQTGALAYFVGEPERGS